VTGRLKAKGANRGGNRRDGGRASKCRGSTEKQHWVGIEIRICVRSSGCILHFGSAHNLVAEIAAQVLRCAQVNPSTRSENRQLGLDTR
jgi:hypothetical protein